jgi:hypothetical protein
MKRKSKAEKVTPLRGQKAAPSTPEPGMDFTTLVSAIRQVHEQCAAAVNRAVNCGLTMRNWLIGCYIRQYEQRGADRAQYGARLLECLAERLQTGLDRCYTGRYLGLCRQLFDSYPEIRKSLISKTGPTASAFPVPTHSIRKSPISKLHPPYHMLAERLSFTHLIELMALDDPLNRAFYEIECIRGNWSVRQLKRQIATLYFERSGMSRDKEKLTAMVNTYVTWYRKHMMAEGDNPPVGLLLCTGKDHALVEYALAAVDNRLFVSKYQIELPSKEALRKFIEAKHREMGTES